MADNEIIKVLEQALHVADETINRQKAEIEEKNGLIERLQNANVRALRGTTEIVKANAKSEAIKEFAERLKKYFETYADDEESNAIYMRNLIDDLVKEMVGEQE